jgi:predicted PurR-regulated permease PerM
MSAEEVRIELSERIGAYVKLNARNILQSYAPTMAVAGRRAGVTVAHLVSSLGQWTLGVVVVVANVALFAFVAGFLLKDFDKLLRGIRDLIPPRYRGKVEEIAGKIHVQITSFLRGQLTVCMCLGAMYILGLTFARVPFSIPIGIFGGVAAFIPYIGITLTIIPSVILTLLAHGFDWHLGAVLATFAIAQFLEGTFLTPKIVGDKVGLNPVWVILAILVFGNAFGFLGILLAVPMAASLKVLVLEGIAYYRASKVFSEPGDSGGVSGGPGVS